MTIHIASLFCLKLFPSTAAAFLFLDQILWQKSNWREKGFVLWLTVQIPFFKGRKTVTSHPQQRYRTMALSPLSLSLGPFNNLAPPTSRVGLLTSINLTWQIPHRKAASQPNHLPRIPPQVIPDPSKLTTENVVIFSLSFQCHPPEGYTYHKHRGWAVLWYKISRVL